MNVITTITGPSCAGKSTLEKMLIERGMQNMISTTTRTPRAGEVDGKSYYFTNEVAFKRMEHDEKAFIEVVQFNGAYYGLSKAEALRVLGLDKPAVVVVDPHGAHQISRFCHEQGIAHIPVFIDGDTEVIARRFLNRVLDDVTDKGTDEALAMHSKRMAAIIREEQEWRVYAPNNYRIYVEHFDVTNQKDVADLITASANLELSRVDRRKRHA